MAAQKQTVAAIYEQCQTHEYVFRTDVKSYYASIDHNILIHQLTKYVKDPAVLNLLSQYIKRTVEFGGTFIDIQKGISSGCPLSPLMASFYLVELDYEMAKKTVFYRRYMDDIIVLAKSHWQLKRAIATINQHFRRLKLKQHPDKTFVGKVKKGFDFLGYQFGSKTLSVAKRTLLNHLRRLSRIYEQKKGHPQWTALLDDYRRLWVSWVYSGIPSSFFNGSYSKRGLYCACLTQAFPTQK
jgi:RNA-directed DNA polymerase